MSTNGTTARKKAAKKKAAPRNRITVTKTKRKAVPTVITIPAPNIQTIKFKIVGDTPLCTHSWDEKAVKMMRDKQAGLKVVKKPKVPWDDFCGSLYWISKRPAKVTKATIKKAKFGFPATAIKAAAVAACRGVDSLKMTEAKQLLFVESDYTRPHDGKDLILINGSPEYLESMVRLQTGVADLRYRGIFYEWSAIVRMQFDADNIAATSVVNLVNRAGLTCGICEWRPSSPRSSTGNWGRFHVEDAG